MQNGYVFLPICHKSPRKNDRYQILRNTCVDTSLASVRRSNTNKNLNTNTNEQCKEIQMSNVKKYK